MVANLTNGNGRPVTTTLLASRMSNVGRYVWPSGATEVARLPHIDVFLDWSNTVCALRTLGQHRPIHRLVHAAVHEFARRLGMVALCCPTTHSPDNRRPYGNSTLMLGSVWCVVRHPVNVHHDDMPRVRRWRNFLNRLRRSYRFVVLKVPVDFRGYHLTREARAKSPRPAERQWLAREKGVDVALASRLIQRANDVDRPFGAIVMSGDFDFAPAVHAVAQLRPPMIPMVAGFYGSVAGNYWRGARFGYLFPFSPIILNNLAELGLR